MPVQWERAAWSSSRVQMDNIITFSDFLCMLHSSTDGYPPPADTVFLQMVAYGIDTHLFTLAVRLDQTFHAYTHSIKSFDMTGVQATLGKLAYWFDGYHPGGWRQVVELLRQITWFPYTDILSTYPDGEKLLPDLVAEVESVPIAAIVVNDDEESQIENSKPEASSDMTCYHHSSADGEIVEVVAKSTEEAKDLMKADAECKKGLLLKQRENDDNRLEKERVNNNERLEKERENDDNRLGKERENEDNRFLKERENDDNRHRNTMTLREMELTKQLEIERLKLELAKLESAPKVQVIATPTRSEASSRKRSLVSPSVVSTTKKLRQSKPCTPIPSGGRSNYRSIAQLEGGSYFPSGYELDCVLIEPCPHEEIFTKREKMIVHVSGVKDGYISYAYRCACFELMKKTLGYAPDYCAKLRVVQVPLDSHGRYFYDIQRPENSAKHHYHPSITGAAGVKVEGEEGSKKRLLF